MANVTPNATVLENTPAMEPPPGQTSNLFNSPNPFFAVSIATWTICSIAVVVCVSIQLFTKSYIMKKLDYTDGLTILAAIGNWAHMAFSITTMMRGGSGQHQWNVSLAAIMYYAYWTMVQTAIYCAALIFSKACVIVPLIKIFSPMKRGLYYWGLWVLLVSITLFYIAGIPVILVACTPRERIWNPFITEGYCIDIDAVWLASSVFNVIADLFIVVLPLFNIWHLHLPMKHKFGISVIFATTLFALIASIARLYYTVLIVNEEDRTYRDRQIGLWGTAEMVTLICCSSMPVMPRFYRWCVGKDETRGSSARPVLSSYHQKSTKQSFRPIGSAPSDIQKLQSMPRSDTQSSYRGRSQEFLDNEYMSESAPRNGITRMVQISTSSQPNGAGRSDESERSWR